VAEFFDRGVGIADAIKGKTGKLKDFKAALAKGADDFPELVQVCNCDSESITYSKVCKRSLWLELCQGVDENL
jgi:hypothetical protein